MLKPVITLNLTPRDTLDHTMIKMCSTLFSVFLLVALSHRGCQSAEEMLSKSDMNEARAMELIEDFEETLEDDGEEVLTEEVEDAYQFIEELNMSNEELLIIGKGIRVKPVVQFGCCVNPTPEEDSWELQLISKEADKQLYALYKLFEFSAPRSVPQQYKTYLVLKESHQDNHTIEEASKRFALTTIQEAIKTENRGTGQDPKTLRFHWFMRAVGAINASECIPRLLVLSSSQNRYTRLAAERSLEEIVHPDAESALIKIAGLFRGDASSNAAEYLFEKKSEAFYRAIPKMNPAEHYVDVHAMWMARINDPRCVPALCKAVKTRTYYWNYYSNISALGRAEDKEIILALPSQADGERIKAAKECVKKYLARMEKDKTD